MTLIGGFELGAYSETTAREIGAHLNSSRICRRPTRASAADQGVRPTIYAGFSVGWNRLDHL